MFHRVLFLSFILPAVVFSYSVIRADGKNFTGELIQQTPHFTILRGEDGVTLKFRSDQIDWNRTTIQLQKEEKARAKEIRMPQQNYESREIKPRRQKWTGERFTFDFKDIDIKDLFRFIADISGLNVILDPAVRGSVTLKLTDVPWDQALDLITRNEGLAYTVEGNVIRIAPYSKIVQEEHARVEAKREQLLNAPLVTRIIHLSYAKATQMEPIVKRLLTAKGSVIVDARTNTMIITDVDTNIDAVSSMVQ